MTVTSERHTQKYRAIDEEKDYRPKRLVGARNERDDGLSLNRFSTVFRLATLFFSANKLG